MENPIKKDDLGVPPFKETPTSTKCLKTGLGILGSGPDFLPNITLERACRKKMFGIYWGLWRPNTGIWFMGIVIQLAPVSFPHLYKGCNSRRNQCTYIQAWVSFTGTVCIYKNKPISYHVTTYSARKKGFSRFGVSLSAWPFYSQTSHRIRKLFSIQAQGNSTVPRRQQTSWTKKWRPWRTTVVLDMF